MTELPGFAEMATETFDQRSPWRCGGCDAPKDSPKPGVPCPFECGSSWTYNIDGDTVAFRMTPQPAAEVDRNFSLPTAMYPDGRVPALPPWANQDTVTLPVRFEVPYEPAHTLRRHRRPVNSFAAGAVVGAVLGLIICALMTFGVVPTPVLRPWWLSLVVGCVGALLLVVGWLALVFRGRRH